MREMSFTGFFVKFTTAPLTLNPIVSIERLSWHTWLEIFWTETSPSFLLGGVVSHHCLSKCHRLLLPLGDLLTRFWLCYWSLPLRPLFELWFVSWLFRLFIVIFTLISSIKDLAFLLENLLANLSMLFISCRSKFSPTSGTLDPVALRRSILLVIGYANRRLLESCRQLTWLSPRVLWWSVHDPGFATLIERVAFIGAHFTSWWLRVSRRGVLRWGLSIFISIVSSSTIILSRLKLIAHGRPPSHTGVWCHIFLSWLYVLPWKISFDTWWSFLRLVKGFIFFHI